MKRRYAMHEAGHAAAWLVRGRPLEYACLFPDAKPFEAQGATQPTPGTALSFDDEVLAALAGRAAEERWMDGLPEDVCLSLALQGFGHPEDDDAAHACLLELGFQRGPEATDEIGRRRGLASDFVVLHWDLVVRIADEIESNTYVAGAILQALADSMRTEDLG